MPVVKTQYEHIILDEANVPMIAGTTMNVIELVLEKTATGVLEHIKPGNFLIEQENRKFS